MMPKSKMSNNRRGKAAALVAIPVFNELKYVDDVLLAARRYSNNILVVDDGSTDGTSDLLKEHDFIQVISHKDNMGFGQSLIDAVIYTTFL